MMDFLKGFGFAFGFGMGFAVTMIIFLSLVDKYLRPNHEEPIPQNHDQKPIIITPSDKVLLLISPIDTGKGKIIEFGEWEISKVSQKILEHPGIRH